MSTGTHEKLYGVSFLEIVCACDLPGTFQAPAAISCFQSSRQKAGSLLTYETENGRRREGGGREGEEKEERERETAFSFLEVLVPGDCH